MPTARATRTVRTRTPADGLFGIVFIKGSMSALYSIGYTDTATFYLPYIFPFHILRVLPTLKFLVSDLFLNCFIGFLTQ